jgi:MFS family permease
MDDFLEKFFPSVYLKKHEAREDNYCKYDNQFLQLFTSSLYLAAIVSSFIASFFCKKFGRKPTIQAASIFFLAGAVLNAVAVELGMLIAGRICLGVGVGFGNQVCSSIRKPTSFPFFQIRSSFSFQFMYYLLLSISSYTEKVNAGGAFVHIRNRTSKI